MRWLQDLTRIWNNVTRAAPFASVVKVFVVR